MREVKHKQKPERLKQLVIPAILFFMALLVVFIPVKRHDIRVNTKIIRASEEFPISLTIEQNRGIISSAWLRTPAGSTELTEPKGMFLTGDRRYKIHADSDREIDLLWVLSFMNFEGKGIHLWISLLTKEPKVIISTTPYEYTRWDALPAKIYVPRDTVLYIAPTSPGYMTDESKFSGSDSYTFVYTIKGTPNGPAFVPVPKVYEQLATFLKPGMRGAQDKAHQVEYIQMLNEFRALSTGVPPSTTTIINMNMKKIKEIVWKK